MAPWHKYAIAVTGIFGSGKSTVSRALEDLGCLRIDADDLSHKQLLAGSPGAAGLIEAYGVNILNESKDVSRPKLREILLSSPKEKTKIESILHPEIAKSAATAAKARESQQLIVYDCPLFFESGLNNSDFLASILVTAPKELCIARGSSRLGISKIDAEGFYNKQTPLEEKVALADYQIDNSGSPEQTKTLTKQIFEKIKESAT